jgi:SAM-dependent methyltransferase
MTCPSNTVRAGYDAVAEEYLAARGTGADELRLLQDLIARLPDGARVLDAGCGAGIPVTRALSERFTVTGVDFSEAQIALARRHVPKATLLCRDMCSLDFPDNAFDAICSFYAVIHVPREQHPALLRSFHRLLVPGGLLLLSMGASDLPDDVEENWLGAGAPMYWSHYGRETNLRMLQEAGFTVIQEGLITEEAAFGGGTHLFVLASRSL